MVFIVWNTKVGSKSEFFNNYLRSQAWLHAIRPKFNKNSEFFCWEITFMVYTERQSAYLRREVHMECTLEYTVNKVTVLLFINTTFIILTLNTT